MNRYLRMSASLCALLAIAGCASTSKLSDSERYTLYREHAGEPIKSFRYFGDINGWSPLDDSALVVWTRPAEAYLLDLYGPCQDLDFAQSIALTNLMGEVSARFDKVVVAGTSMQIPCRIEEIRKIDVKALRQTERDLRGAAMTPRDADQAGGAKVGMANPASVNCAKLGGTSIPRTAADGGQSADCKLPDGQQCDEWTLFREGKCPAPGAAK